ncbi:MAG: helix-turn-helix domain-containing protein, partial [Thiohalomonadales bacterium]
MLQSRSTANQNIVVVSKVFNITKSQIRKTSANKRVRNDARKFAIYLCQRHGDIPLNKIADKFEL